MVAKEKYYRVYNSYIRSLILELCKTMPSASQIKKILGISTGALYHHLQILEKEGLITKQYIRDKEGHKRRGRETIIKLNEERLYDMELQHRRESRKKLKNYLNMNTPELKKLREKILQAISVKPLTIKKIRQKFVHKYGDDEVTDILFNFDEGYLEIYAKITDKGKELLKKKTIT